MWQVTGMQTDFAKGEKENSLFSLNSMLHYILLFYFMHVCVLNILRE